jgi:hypothetical protein
MPHFGGKKHDSNKSAVPRNGMEGNGEIDEAENDKVKIQSCAEQAANNQKLLIPEVTF